MSKGNGKDKPLESMKGRALWPGEKLYKFLEKNTATRNVFRQACCTNLRFLNYITPIVYMKIKWKSVDVLKINHCKKNVRPGKVKKFSFHATPKPPRSFPSKGQFPEL
jgi:hypothetical protein